ncbi:MAG TPA: hypothetical protein VMU99_07230 [Acidimicrobiales bacterium]|nr:hypothetical protein [Acidimicrobiales bacterium]
MSNRTQLSIPVPVETAFGHRLQNGLRFAPSLRTAWQIIHSENSGDLRAIDPEYPLASPEPDAFPDGTGDAPGGVQITAPVAS